MCPSMNVWAATTEWYRSPCPQRLAAEQLQEPQAAANLNLPLYLSGAQPPGLLVYSTLHTCRLPLLLALAAEAPSSTGHTLVMRPDWPAYVSRLANDTSRSRRRMSHTCATREGGSRHKVVGCCIGAETLDLTAFVPSDAVLHVATTPMQYVGEPQWPWTRVSASSHLKPWVPSAV